MDPLYDNPTFFEKYSRMYRSQQGLAGAGEWPALKPLLPDFTGKRVLDLGCGYGWHCAYAARQGAKYVLGIDNSQKMLEVAKAKNSAPEIEYRRASIQELSLPEESFDLVFSSLAIHYLPDYPGLVEQVKGWLAPKGDFVFSVEHPIFTAQGPRTGSTARRGKSSTSRWTTTFTRDSGRRCF